MNRIALGLLAVVATAGLADFAVASTPSRHVVGGIVYAGGPKSADDGGYQPGTVRLLRAGKVIARRTVHTGEQYDFTVRPGVYRLSTTLGDARCSRTIRVKRHRRHADLRCSVK